ncbi:MAG TPA: hypothetical protein DCM87_01160 [Planctomycetes bacterium]|nr:hypothetical protein [Planctomycetota bacterium]
MALTTLQRDICKLIAAQRIESGESYLAGGAALNAVMGAGRVSRDLDLFHDTAEALAATWDADTHLLEARGYRVEVVRERPSFVEAIVSRGEARVLVQWAQDSAYRFFPLVRHDELGLILHPFDLATNKVLALAGRVEPRDWVDTIECHERIQGLGFLSWAACGKDPGFSPRAILDHAARTARYSAGEISALSFEGPAPDAGELARRWKRCLGEAEHVIALLPEVEAGKAVVDPEGGIYRGAPDDVARDLAQGIMRFHAGAIRGAWPRVMPR